MKKKKTGLTFLTAGILIMSALSLSAQQIDPFYSGLLDKAQKSFVTGNYGEAARSFEIAAFGLAGDRKLLAKACVYLSLCKYYLKDLQGSETSLREAAALMGQEGFGGLEIYESAWPDLDKLIVFFNLGQTSNPVPPKEVAKPLPANSEPPGANPVEPKKEPEVKGPRSTAEEKTPAAKSVPPGEVKITEVKEGDIVPLELVDTPPVPITRVPAAYPPQARLLRPEGTVTLNALVSEKGDVIETKILRGLKNAPGLEQASQEAVRKWKFSPASVKGTRVKVWFQVLIEFTRKPSIT